MPKNITVFSTPTCAYCPMVKRWLDSKNIKYEEVDLVANPERQQEVLELSGALTVPITIVTKQDDTKEVVIGFNLSKLATAVV